LKSSLRCRSTATIAVPAVKWEHSIFAMARSFGPGSFALRSAHSLPPFFDTQSLPSSLPAQMVFMFSNDGATE